MTVYETSSRVHCLPRASCGARVCVYRENSVFADVFNRLPRPSPLAMSRVHVSGESGPFLVYGVSCGIGYAFIKTMKLTERSPVLS